MKLSVIIFGVLAACAMSYAVESGPLITMLQREPQPEYQPVVLVEPQNRQKRSLILGAVGLGAVGLGAAALGAGAVGLGALGAGAVGAGVIGAKAGFIGGALASRAFHGRSYGGYYGGGYGGYGGGYSSYGGYGYYGGGGSYSSYPTVYVDDGWY